MKKIFLSLLLLISISLTAQTTSTALKSSIDAAITNKSGASSISKTDVLVAQLQQIYQKTLV